MVAARITIDGERNLRRNLNRLRRDLPGRIASPGMRELGLFGQQYARTHRGGWNNRTGNAWRSIRVEQQRDAPGTGRFQSGWALVAGGRRAPYFVYLEARYATIRMAFNAMRRNGARIVSRRARREFGQAVRRIIR